MAESVDTCWECFGRDFYYESSRSCFLYEGPVKEALYLLKYSKKISLANMFRELFIDFLHKNPGIMSEVDGVAAVPMHSPKLREREFNHAYLLAKAVIKEFGIQDLSGCIKRDAATRPQSELERKERFANVRGAFRAVEAGQARDKNLLLVDDLFTTGATLNECARVLKGAGAGSVRCLTFARGQ
ncbi:MAG: ComF family protein [Candidatus Omnitrophica bacterium]|nr:ComF family protein [Candidatus Omnitrophota bacterium]